MLIKLFLSYFLASIGVIAVLTLSGKKLNPNGPLNNVLSIEVLDGKHTLPVNQTLNYVDVSALIPPSYCNNNYAVMDLKSEIPTQLHISLSPPPRIFIGEHYLNKVKFSKDFEELGKATLTFDQKLGKAKNHPIESYNLYYYIPPFSILTYETERRKYRCRKPKVIDYLMFNDLIYEAYFHAEPLHFLPIIEVDCGECELKFVFDRRTLDTKSILEFVPRSPYYHLGDIITVECATILNSANYKVIIITALPPPSPSPSPSSQQASPRGRKIGERSASVDGSGNSKKQRKNKGNTRAMSGSPTPRRNEDSGPLTFSQFVDEPLLFFSSKETIPIEVIPSAGPSNQSDQDNTEIIQRSKEPPLSPVRTAEQALKNAGRTQDAQTLQELIQATQDEAEEAHQRALHLEWKVRARDPQTPQDAAIAAALDEHAKTHGGPCKKLECHHQ